jgi:hypothetical protein
MQARRLIIVGDSLFADTLERILSVSAQVQVIGTAPTPEAAFERIAETLPEAIIVAGASDSSDVVRRQNRMAPAAQHWSQLLVLFPDIPLVRADLATESLLLITCKHVNARPAELIHALSELPLRVTIDSVTGPGQAQSRVSWES